MHMAQLMPLPLTVSSFTKIQIGFTFLVPADPGSPGKRAVKRVRVCIGIVTLLCVANICHSTVNDTSNSSRPISVVFGTVITE